MHEIIIINANICQIIDKKIIPVFGDIYISNGTITDIKKREQFFNSKSNYSAELIIDANGRVVTVPLVNFHDHFYSRLAKGLNISDSTEAFISILNNLWWKLDMLLDKEMIKASAQLAAIESIKNGVTYIFDHHSSPNSAIGSLNVIKDVLNLFELNGVLCFETTDRNGNTLSELGFNENTDFFFNEQESKIRSMIGLHASFTVNDDTLSAVSQFLGNHDAGIHIHLAEDNYDNVESEKLFGNTPLMRLKDFGLLNQKSILAHSIHLKPEEYKLISDCGSAIVFNLDSNLNNSVGLPDFSLIRENIPVLIGTDGMHADIAKSQKQLFLLLRNQRFSMDSAFSFFINSYFSQIEFLKRYFPSASSLNVGDNADIIIWDYFPPTPLNQDNFFSHYIYGILESKIETVISSGKTIMIDGKILICDENQIRSEIAKQGHRLFHLFNEKL